MSNLANMPSSLVNEWPEIFEDLNTSTLPIEYLDMIHIEFTNGRVWEFNIREGCSNYSTTVIVESLLDILSDYHSEIKQIDFKVNVAKLKADIQESSKKMF